MRRLTFIVCFVLLSGTVFAEAGKDVFTLQEAVAYAIKNNPGLAASTKDVEIGTHGVNIARAGRLPRIDFSGGASRFRYAAPITPISGAPYSGVGFPEFDNTLYDAGLTFTLPLYRGGRLDAEVRIAEMKKNIAEDILQMNKQDLIYNITGVYYKILELERLLGANKEAVKQLEAHYKNAELLFQAGTAPRIDLLKAGTELAHARQGALLIKNNLESAGELLMTLMGIDNMHRKIALAEVEPYAGKYPAPDEGLSLALAQRPDYMAALKKIRLAEERVRYFEGKRLPALNLSGEYTDRSGENINFKENWNLMLRLTLPVFDGGTIKSETAMGKKEAEKAHEEERALRSNIVRELKDSYMNIENAAARIDVIAKAVETAREASRIEHLRYAAGAGVSTDVIDAQTALLRAETDYYQALYDKETAIAALVRAIGGNVQTEVSR